MSLTYFAKNNAGTEELWVSDGTVAGTHLVKPFGNSGLINLTVIGARAYFAVDDGVHGNELWISDGTAADTSLVDDVFPGPSASFPNNLVNVNGTLFFNADDGTHGFELWKSDGTLAGTKMVADIQPGAGGSDPSDPINIDGVLFFAADDGAHGFELWKSDGTPAGTRMVTDIDAGAGGSGTFELTNVNGELFFSASDGAHGKELWKSDGTAAGTVMVKDINPGAGDSIDTVLPFVSVNGALFFTADDGTHGFELWKSDGTAAGTVMIDNIDSSSGSSITFAVGNFVNVGGTLFFTADDGTHGNELWKSDGTAAGTMMVKDIIPGSPSALPQDLTNVNGVLEFYASDGTSEGLWRSDGTAAGTVEIASNVDTATPIGFTPAPVVNDFNSDGRTDILWRNANGTLAEWGLNGSVISASSFLTSSGAVVAPGSSWSVAGISDFNGDGRADVLWRNTDGTLVDWTMNGSTIAASGTLNLGGVAVRPDASWSVTGIGDFDGDSRSDILWRNADGMLADWSMNGSTIMSSGFVTAGGRAVKPDASWSVAGIGDFDGDGRSDILWRNATGEVTAWLMNGSKIAGSGDITVGAAAARPDASWSIAGVGDFNHDGKSDLLWRSASGSLAMWLMNGSTIASSGLVTFNGSAIAPDASWQVVEIGDFNGDGSADILWRNNNGALAEWLMNGNAIAQSFTPTSNGAIVSPDASWSTQAKPTISA